MATTLYFRGDNTGREIIGQHTQATLLSGAGGSVEYYPMSTSRGSAAVSRTRASVLGTTNGIELTGPSGTYALAFVSDPVDAAVTISSTITLNLRGLESNMSANGAINAKIERLDNNCELVSTIATTARVTELGTAEAAANFTVSPTSTSLAKGDRIRVYVFFDDATPSVMASGYTFTFWFNGPTAAASGDSYVTFTENFGLMAAPAGTTMYLRDDAGPAVSADLEKLIATTAGAATASSVTNSFAGFAAATRLTNTAGGTALEWYTNPLEAFTLSGVIEVTLPGTVVSSALSTAQIRAEVAVTNEDGSGATVFGTGSMEGVYPAGLDTIEASEAVIVSGADLSVSSGQRIRLRLLLDDLNAASLSGRTVTVKYGGTAAYQATIRFSNTVQEKVSPVPRHGFVNFQDPGVL